MSQVRKTPIYGNCQVFSPDGELMFRCVEKRAKWYLSRNLATVISSDPLSVKLNFQPKGKGEKMDVLKMERQNKCVVCGAENLDILTKHHLVPFVYRQHFAQDRKNHSSLFVVPICRSCHFQYENDFANPLKSALATAYSAPFNGGFENERKKTLGYIRCLTIHVNQIPIDRKEFIVEKLKQDLIDLGIYKDENLLDNDVLKDFTEKLEKETKEQALQTHGKIVVERLKDIDEFEKMWAKHFIDSMQPKYMPEYFFKTLCNSSE